MFPRRQKREQDVVVLPVAILDIGKFGVALFDHLGAVAADENDVFFLKAASGERFEHPFQNRATHDRNARFRDFFGQVFEPAAATCSNDDGAHASRHTMGVRAVAG
jgi:hypothetical protein